MSANDIQVGGDHYKKLQYEPWDVITAWGLGYLDGNAVKYLARWKSKGGVKDLEKAKHYIEKLIEVENEKQMAAAIQKAEFEQSLAKVRAEYPQAGRYGDYQHRGYGVEVEVDHSNGSITCSQPGFFTKGRAG